jgi:hypothetical protein
MRANLHFTNFFQLTNLRPSSFSKDAFFRVVFLWVTTMLIGFQSTSSRAQELGLWIPSYEVDKTQWTPSNPDSNLSMLHDLGIETLIVPLELLSEGNTLSTLANQWAGNLVIDYGVQFIDAYNLERQQDSLLNQYASGMLLARQQPSITGHLMHRYSPFQDSLFSQRWSRITQILNQFNPSDLFYVVPESLDSTVSSLSAEPMRTQWISRAQIFESPFQWDDLVRLENAFRPNTAARVIWLTPTWLEEAFLAHPSLEESLVFWNNTGDFMVAEPAEKLDRVNTHWSKPFMVVLILLFLVLYQQSQVYRQTPTRYFTNYSFLIDDMLRYSERYVPIGFLLFVLRAGVVSLSCVIWGLSNGTDLDWAYLGHLLVGQRGPTPNTFLFWGLLSFVLLVIQFVELLLLRIPNSGYRSMRQIFVIYSWNIHLNLILLLFIFIAFANQFSIVNGVTILYLIVLLWWIGFVLSAIQGTKETYRGGKRYLFWTLGMYTSIVGLGMYTLSQSESAQGIMSIFLAL